MSRPNGMDFDCSVARPLLSALLDGELDDLRASRLRRHIEACPACREEWETMAALSSELRTQGRSTPQAPDWSVLQDRLENRSAVPWKLLAAAVFLLAVLAVWLAGNFTTRDDSPVLAGVSIDAAAELLGALLEPGGMGDMSDLGAVRKVMDVSSDDLPRTAGFTTLAPAFLPGGFRREGCRVMDIQGCRLVSVRYRRNDEILVVLQHDTGEKSSCCASNDICSVLGNGSCERERLGDARIVKTGCDDLILTLAGRIDNDCLQRAARHFTGLSGNCSPAHPQE